MIINCCKMTPVQSQYCMFSMIISCHYSCMALNMASTASCTKARAVTWSVLDTHANRHANDDTQHNNGDNHHDANEYRLGQPCDGTSGGSSGLGSLTDLGRQLGGNREH
jgi:hypothetical protein